MNLHEQLDAINSHDELAVTVTNNLVIVSKVDDRPIGNELIGDYIERIAGREALAGLTLIDGDEAASVATYKIECAAMSEDDEWVVCDDETWCNWAMMYRASEVPTQRDFATSAGFDNADEFPNEPLPTEPLAEYLESVDYHTGNLIIDGADAENAVRTIIETHNKGE